MTAISLRDPGPTAHCPVRLTPAPAGRSILSPAQPRVILPASTCHSYHSMSFRPLHVILPTSACHSDHSLSF